MKTVPVGIYIMALCVAAYASGPGKFLHRIVFDEQQIEGKIRRPQLVLIKVEQRPSFSPMVMQSLGRNTSIVEFVSPSVIEESPYDDSFRFNGTKVSNYVP